MRSSWKVAGVVERAALEMRCTGDCTGGSNPSLSAQRKGERSSPSQKKPSPASSLAGLEFFWLSRCLWHRLSSVQGSPRMGITAARRNPLCDPPRGKRRQAVIPSRKLACRAGIFLAVPMPLAKPMESPPQSTSEYPSSESIHQSCKRKWQRPLCPPFRCVQCDAHRFRGLRVNRD